MNTRVTYYPWSTEVLSERLAAHDANRLATLDLDFTAQCSRASCVYCDSRPGVGRRHSAELDMELTEKLLADAKGLGVTWVYACGLGEPLEDMRFRQLVELSTRLGLRLSLFTNAMLIDRGLAKWLHEHNVCLIVKLDTFQESTFDKILGRKGGARKIYRAIENLLEVGYAQQTPTGLTDLAFSIVPTKLNVDDIGAVVSFAKEHNIFPSVGQLECAGRAKETKCYGELSLGSDDLLALKQAIEKILWQGYTRPICPTIITGVHIDNTGDCVVDTDTGLNCKWFMLREPRVTILGSLKTETIASLWEKVTQYRRRCFEFNEQRISECEKTEYIFGGCGGSPKEVVRLARTHLR